MIASVIYVLAKETESLRLLPKARYDVMADDKVHPVPCVFAVLILGEEKRRTSEDSAL